MTKKAKRPGNSLEAHYESVLGDISNVIDAAKRSAARSVNCITTAAYWLIGWRIVAYEQGGKERAQYGEAATGETFSRSCRWIRTGVLSEICKTCAFSHLAHPPDKNLADTVCQIG